MERELNLDDSQIIWERRSILQNSLIEKRISNNSEPNNPNHTSKSRTKNTEKEFIKETVSKEESQPSQNLDLDDNLVNIDINNFTKRKENLLYLSFEDNTNIRHRSGLKNYFSQFKWAKILYKKNEIFEYENDLRISNFVLCPQGNGIDTHRIWESLYCGSIPIVEDHIGFDQFKNLPIMFVDDFYKISEKSLENFLDLRF